MTRGDRAGTHPFGATRFWDILNGYGADRGGSIDSTGALVDSIEEAHAVGGGVVYAPGGNYKLSGTLPAYSDVAVIGDGSGATTFTQTADVDTFYGVDQRRLMFRGFKIVGLGSGTGRGINIPFSASASFNNRFEDLYIKSCGGDGVHVEESCASVFSNVRSESNGGRGIYVDNGTSTVFEACYANANAVNGFDLQTMTYCTIIGGAADGNVIAYNIKNGGEIHLAGTGCEGSGTGFQIDGASNVSLVSPYVSGATSLGYYITGSALNATLIAPREVNPNGATASIKTDAGTSLHLMGERVTTALALTSGTYRRFSTSEIDLTGTGSVTNRVDRGTTATFATLALATAGVDEWGLRLINDATNDVELRNIARGLTAFGVQDRATMLNLALLARASAVTSWGGMVGGVFIPNANTAPGTNPTGGGFLYVTGGALTYRGSGGTVTTLGPA